MGLEQCRSELRSIISELQDIERGVRNDFAGIGQDMCANCIVRLIENYQGVLSRLENVNYSRIADWMIERHTQGGTV